MDETKPSQSTSLHLPGPGAPPNGSTRRKGFISRLWGAIVCRPFSGVHTTTPNPTTPAAGPTPPPASNTSAGTSGDQTAEKEASTKSYDALGSELDDNARIWHFFRTNVTAYDQTVTIREWNETLDVLLVFAALFLGAVTSFVIQAYPALSPSDGNEAPSLLLTVAIGLFFCSLVVSLAVSLICILAKQWLQEYTRRLTEPTESARYWARRRWIYELGLKEWEIALLCTDGLPFMLHLALFLFAVGLVMLLSTLQRAIAWVVGAITCLLAMFYVCSTLAPIVSVNAPTATPLLRRQVASATPRESRWAKILALTPRILFERFSKPWHLREKRYLETRVRDVELSTMEWLLTVSREEASIEVAFSAVSALPPGSPALEFVRMTGIGIADAFQNMHGDKLRGIDIMRVIRSELHVRPGDWRRPRLGLDIPQEMLKRLSEVESADAQLLHALMQKTVDFARIAKHAKEWRDMESPSLLATIRLLLRSKFIEAQAVLYLLLPLHARDIRGMRSDFAALASEEKMRAESERKKLLKPGSSLTAADDGDMRHALEDSPLQLPTVQSSGGNEAWPSPAAEPLSRTQRTEQDSAAALVSLAEVTTKFACNCSELSLAAQLAVRIAAPVKDGLPALISSVPWQEPLDKIQLRAPEIFAAFRSKDAVLGWCRTQTRLLHAIVSEWCILEPPKSDAPPSTKKPQSRILLGRRAAFILESLLAARDNPDFSALVRSTITSMLLITFLDTTRPLETALKDREGSRIKPAEATTQSMQQPAKNAWSDVRRLQLSHSALLRLAVVLSGELCSALRGDGIKYHKTLVSVFFASDCLGTLLAESSRVERLKPSKVYVHLAQHCAELDGNWFLTMGAASSTSGASKQSLGLDVLAGWVKSRRERARNAAVPAPQVPATSASIVPNLSTWSVDPIRLRGAIRCFFAGKLKDEVDKVGPCTSCAGSPQYLKWIRSEPPSDLVLRLGSSSSTAAPHEYHLAPAGQATS